MKITPEQIKKLQEPLPEAAISPHPTKPYLSSIKVMYVIERLNEVFGIGAWRLKSHVIKDSDAMIIVQSFLTIPECDIELEAYGGNDNGGAANINFDLGDAYKGAVTDAFTKMCSYLEIGKDVYKGLRDKPPPPPKKTPPAKTNLYNKKQIGVLPVVPNKWFKQICERLDSGDNGVYDEAIKRFSFTEEQKRIIDEKHKKNAGE